MTREKELDWLYRLRSNLHVYMPKEWVTPMNIALEMAIKTIEQETVSRESYEHEYFLRKEFELKIYKLQRQLEEQALEQEPCEDCISREEAVTEINKYHMTSGVTHQCVWNECVGVIAETIQELPPVIPQSKTRWIPVSERLPNYDECIKNNGLFNVFDGNRTYTEWFDVHDKQRFGEFTMYGFRVDYAVTAWMPLPEPYKPERERKEW